ncbi:MAG TPA: nucleotidyltransferase domain-containing protein, partial [Candidatus Melainabacteria bacterium]|nr:nucleotidyltransferase domain-containing protein [Candidatus Melainabacteria bacterium]
SKWTIRKHIITMTKEERVSPHLILPEGTHVVTLVSSRDQGGSKERAAGAVGVIVKSPTDNLHAYVIQYSDGGRVSLFRKQIAIRKQVQNISFENPNAALLDRDLKDHIIYSCIVGSRAYGLEHEESDIDRRGIYLPPAELHWSLYGVPEQIEEKGGTTDEVYFELQKFLTLSLKARPDGLWFEIKAGQ